MLLLGDKLNDFTRDYCVAGMGEHVALTDAEREPHGRRFIVLPDPTDGHWMRAIFGDWEPAPTDETRAALKADAVCAAWHGRGHA